MRPFGSRAITCFKLFQITKIIIYSVEHHCLSFDIFISTTSFVGEQDNFFIIINISNLSILRPVPRVFVNSEFVLKMDDNLS